jgi:chromosome segregation ATPase
MGALETLEVRVEALLASHGELTRRLDAQEQELARLRAELARFGRERAELRARVEALLAEVDAVALAVGEGR